MNVSSRYANPVGEISGGHERLYQALARRLFHNLAEGRYAVGDRLPAERDLADEHNVSRPTVREAIIALEVQGYLDVRIGSGAYVKRLPSAKDAPAFNVTAFELTEARLLIEGESAALAAGNITDEELDELETLVSQMTDHSHGDQASFDADYAFHMLIAHATRNAALHHAVAELWRMRASSPDSAMLHAKARSAAVTPVADEHSAIVAALRTHDPARARAAMRTHLAAVLDHLLFATEEEAVEAARRAVASKRARFNNVALL